MGFKKKSGVLGPKSDVDSFVRSGVFFRPWTSDLGLRTILLVVSLFTASMVLGDTGRAPTLDAIGNEVQCTCGCNAPLNGCPHLDCAEKAQMQALIKKEIAEGKDETAILQDLSLRYGLQVLSTPPARGFNLSIWILPSIGLLLGLGFVVVLARRWKRKPALVPVASNAPVDPKLLSAMEAEMKSTGMK
jgi:cytochrome c-type biogenesis protein CcmH/NrfF